MARVELTPTSILGPHPSSPSAGQFDVTFSSVDEVSGNEFALTGKEIIVFHNTNTTAVAGITLTSVADPYNRTGDLTATLGSGEYAAFYAGDIKGWRQSTGAFYFTGSISGLKAGILRISRES